MVRYITGYVIFRNGTTLLFQAMDIYMEEADKYEWQQNLRTCGFFGYYLY